MARDWMIALSGKSYTSFLNLMSSSLNNFRVDWDAGFIEGRQYGRGKSGGQVRDEYRQDFDGGRGGYGKIIHNPKTDKAI